MEILIGALVLAATTLTFIVARKSWRHQSAPAERYASLKASKDDVLLI
jgi:hypothetical protein